MVETCGMTLEEVARVATEAVTPPAGTEATWTAKGSPSRVKLALHFVSYRDDAGACHEVDSAKRSACERRCSARVRARALGRCGA